MREETSLLSPSFCGLELERRVCGGLSMGTGTVEIERFDLRLTWGTGDPSKPVGNNPLTLVNQSCSPRGELVPPNQITTDPLDSEHRRQINYTR